MPGALDVALGLVDPSGAFGLNTKGPKKQYYGGDAQTLEEQRQLTEQGRTSGAAQVDTGLGYLGTAAQDARANEFRGDEVYRYGMDVGEQGRRDENLALRDLLTAATQRGPSMAEAQQQAGLGQLQRAMVARAADTRGGNQAAAQRNANAAGVEAGMGMLERQGALRAAEEDARIQRELAARNAIAQARAGQASRGYGLLGAGLGASGQAVGQLAGAGGEIAGIGWGREGGYLGAGQNVNAAQLGADTGYSNGKMAGDAAMTGGLLSTAGTIVGGIYGGKAGADAGGQAGQNVGGSSAALSNPYSSQLDDPRKRYMTG